jgi:hypothetical protein
MEAISSSTVRRWLHGAAIKPWRYQSWIFPRDSQFAVKRPGCCNTVRRTSPVVELCK